MTQFAIHNVTRSVHHRAHRQAAPTALRKKQFVGTDQLPLRAGQRMLVDEAFIQANLDELRQKADGHILEVRTVDGRLVDLKTMQPGPAVPTPLLPHPKLDSVADDKQVGQYIPPYVGEDGALPEVLLPGQKPDLVEQAATEFAMAEEAAASAAPAPADPAPQVDELEAAVAAAQDAAAPSADEGVSSEGKKGGKKSKR